MSRYSYHLLAGSRVKLVAEGGEDHARVKRYVVSRNALERIYAKPPVFDFSLEALVLQRREGNEVDCEDGDGVGKGEMEEEVEGEVVDLAGKRVVEGDLNGNGCEVGGPEVEELEEGSGLESLGSASGMGLWEKKVYTSEMYMEVVGVLREEFGIPKNVAMEVLSGCEEGEEVDMDRMLEDCLELMLPLVDD